MADIIIVQSQRDFKVFADCMCIIQSYFKQAFCPKYACTSRDHQIPVNSIPKRTEYTKDPPILEELNDGQKISLIHIHIARNGNNAFVMKNRRKTLIQSFSIKESIRITNQNNFIFYITQCIVYCIRFPSFFISASPLYGYCGSAWVYRYSTQTAQPSLVR